MTKPELRALLAEYEEACAAAKVEDTAARFRSRDSAYDRLALKAVNNLQDLLDQNERMERRMKELEAIADELAAGIWTPHSPLLQRLAAWKDGAE